MDVILHLGAHRTASKTFQHYMRRHADQLAARGIGYWGPRRDGHPLVDPTANGVAVSKEVAAVMARLHRALDRAERRGLNKLVISDPDLMGSLQGNVAAGALYPEVAARMARCARLFDGRLHGVILSVRGLGRYWTSALAAAVAEGGAVPGPERFARIARSSRGWREVICDIGTGMPGVELRVLPFESYCGRPDALLAQGAQVDAPFDRQRCWLGRAPVLPDLRRALNRRGATGSVLPFGTGLWNPFTNEEHALLRERHADDMMWLTAGADGLATLTEDTLADRTGPTPSDGSCKEGLRDEQEERQMARPG